MNPDDDLNTGPGRCPVCGAPEGGTHRAPNVPSVNRPGMTPLENRPDHELGNDNEE